MADGRQTMDFFDSQSQALRRTALLVFLFCVAVVLIIVGLYLAISALFAFQFDEREIPFIQKMFNPKLFFWVAGATVFVVAAGTLAKIIELREGGSAVAFMLGGVPVPLDTKDPDERKLLNVIEEMSLASGCPQPSVFILRKENRINAFAAGFSPSDAAIGVTRGAVKLLSRDELQGVIAHEFSHIVRGDMRLNIKLIGVLNGILLIGITGTAILRGGVFGAVVGGGGHRRSSRGSGGEGGGGAVVFILAVGLVLMIVGFVGVFFGKMIKAAVSRQREYLADAAAVQYTRNPSGLGSALRKIGGMAGYSRISDSHAEQASHLFFGNAVKSELAALSTHPPLPERIKQIEPQWDGTFPKVKGLDPYEKDYGPLKQRKEERKAQPKQPEVQPIPFPIPGAAVGGAQAAQQGGKGFMFSPQQVVASIGQITPEGLTYAGNMIESLPQELRDRAHEPETAGALLFALLVEKEEKPREREKKYLRENTAEGTLEEVEACLEQLDKLDARARLPLVEMAIPALRQMTHEEKEHFLERVHGLVEADESISLFEFCVEKLLENGLFTRPKRGAQYYSVNALSREVSILLSAIAYAGSQEPDAVQRCFDQGVQVFGRQGKKFQLQPRKSVDTDAIGGALDRLSVATPHIRKRLLEACAACILADREVLVSEAELLRAVSAALDCPMPPILPEEGEG